MCLPEMSRLEKVPPSQTKSVSSENNVFTKKIYLPRKRFTPKKSFFPEKCVSPEKMFYPKNKSASKKVSLTKNSSPPKKVFHPKNKSPSKKAYPLVSLLDNFVAARLSNGIIYQDDIKSLY